MTRAPEPMDGHPDDAALEALYRQGAQEEPPRHVDQAILAAAYRELGTPRPAACPSWWSRWRVGLSLATTLILSAGVVLLVERESPQPASMAPSAPPGETEATPSGNASPRADRQGIPSTPPSPEKRSAESVRDAASAPVSAGKLSPQNAQERVPAAPALESRERVAAPAQQAVQPSPEDQINTIRSLLKKGQESEARAALAVLRKERPDFPIPADLRFLQTRP